MKTRTVVKAKHIKSVKDIADIERYESKITSMYWSAIYYPLDGWRRNGFKPMSREEILRECQPGDREAELKQRMQGVLSFAESE